MTVTKIEYRSQTPAVPLVAGIPTLPTKTGWDAVIEHEGVTMYLSRLDGETVWTVDGLLVDGRPVHMNGWGARYLRTDIAAPAVAAVLDRAVDEYVLDEALDAMYADA